MNIVVIGADKGSRDAIFVFSARNGSLVNKIPLKQSATKVRNTHLRCLFLERFAFHAR
jgi:hypothetical protein